MNVSDKMQHALSAAWIDLLIACPLLRNCWRRVFLRGFSRQMLRARRFGCEPESHAGADNQTVAGGSCPHRRADSFT
jgi:hypothetical protein